MNNIVFLCHTCNLTGSRVDCFSPKPDQVPGFDDICPRCSSDDLTISDSDAEEASNNPYKE